MEKQYHGLQDPDVPLSPDVPPSYQSSAQRTPTTDESKKVEMWSGDGVQQEYPGAHHHHSIFSDLRHAANESQW